MRFPLLLNLQPATLTRWANDLVRQLEAFQAQIDARKQTKGAIQFLAPYPVTDVPPAADYRNAVILVTDEAGGAVPAFSDGTAWRRVTDRAVIS